NNHEGHHSRNRKPGEPGNFPMLKRSIPAGGNPDKECIGKIMSQYNCEKHQLRSIDGNGHYPPSECGSEDGHILGNVEKIIPARALKLIINEGTKRNDIKNK